SWLKLERAWMAQRARRTPARPALRWEALDARLSSPERATVRRANRTALLLGAAAAGVLLCLGLMTPRSPRAPEVPEGVGVDACVDAVGEAMSALEVRLGACLVASPVLALR
ncbi:MAG: hypothetical protein L0Y64_13410, partial [Myxococcaceae bacterium]|nr:hypothetical protein [Myxococcaceae bacterium]